MYSCLTIASKPSGIYKHSIDSKRQKPALLTSKHKKKNTTSARETLTPSEWEERLWQTLLANNGKLPIPDDHNAVLEIDNFAKQDGHQTWGFVIYRCTYSSDADWKEFLQRLRARTLKALKFYERESFMDTKLVFTIMEDEKVFEGASTGFVREHFKNWVMDAPLREQGVGAGRSPRYQYCIHVDDAVVQSVLHDNTGTGPKSSTKGFVNIINKDWKEDGRWDEWDYLDPSSLEPNEALEGVRLWNVGWMRVEYRYLMVHWYSMLRNDASWINEYRRPPQLAADP